MRKLLVSLDDDLANLLAKYPNQNETVRLALKLYISDIVPETLEGIRAAYGQLTKAIVEVDSKINYIASKIK